LDKYYIFFILNSDHHSQVGGGRYKMATSLYGTFRAKTRNYSLKDDKKRANGSSPKNTVLSAPPNEGGKEPKIFSLRRVERPRNMPSKILRCDFCETDFRKTDLPAHIKAKHMTELAKHLVEDAKGSSTNVINSYLRGACPKTMPIPSRLYEGTDYWFGAKPIMIEEKDNATPYLAVQTNMDCHKAFIKELMDYVSLNDYMEIGRQTQLRSPEMNALQHSLKQLQDQHLLVVKDHAIEMAKLMREVEEYRQTLSEVNEGITHKELRHQIHSLQKDLSIVNTKNERLVESYDILKWKYEDLEKKYDELYISSRESQGRANLEMEEGYLKHIEQLRDSLRKEREKSALAKKDAKTSDKKKEEKERMKAELKAAKAKAKALAKQLEDSDSDDE